MYGNYSSHTTQSRDTSAQTLHRRKQGTRNTQPTWTKLFFSFKISFIFSGLTNNSFSSQQLDVQASMLFKIYRKQLKMKKLKDLSKLTV